MEHLSSSVLTQINLLPFGGREGSGIFDLGEDSGDVIGCAVGLETRAGVVHDLQEKSRGLTGNDAQGFEVTGAGGFHVEQIAAHSPKNGLETELVRPAVDADFGGA